MALNKNELQILLTARDEATAKIKQSFKDIGVQGKVAEKKVTSSFNKMGMSAQRLTQIIGVTGMLFAFKKMVDVAIDFESAFVGVRKTVDATEKEFVKLRENLIEMSTKIPIAATELAKIQEIAGQLGIRGVKELTKFTEIVAKIGATTNLSSEQAAISFARISNVIGEPIENVDQMASVVVDLGNKIATTEAEIVTFAQRISGAGKVAGLSSKDIFAIGAAMTSVGIQAELGGTAVQKILLDLQGKGKKGIGAFIGFVRELEEAGDGASKTLEALGFNNERVKRAFLSLASAGGKLEETIGIANEAYAENSALSIEFAKRAESTASKVTLLKNEFSKMSVVMGDILLPIIRDASEGYRIMIGWIEKAAHAVGTASMKMQDFLVGQGGGEATDYLKQRLEEERIIAGESIEIEREKQEEKKLIVEEAQTEIQSIILNKDQETIDALRENMSLWLDEKSAAQMAANQSEIARNKFFIDVQKKAHADLWSKATTLSNQFSSGLSKSLMTIIKGTGDTAKAFEDLGWSMVKTLIDYGIQILVNNALALATHGQQIAMANVSGPAVATAWAPAAAMVSLATFGTNSISAISGMATSVGVALGLSKIPALAEGGIVNRPTLALIGEAGPEAVVPLNGSNGMKSVNINIEMNNTQVRSEDDIELLLEQLSDMINREAERL